MNHIRINRPWHSNKYTSKIKTTKAPTPTPTPVSENTSGLDALQQTEASIANLEFMQITGTVSKMNAPVKTYADTVKTPSLQLNYTKHQEQQRIRA